MSNLDTTALVLGIVILAVPLCYLTVAVYLFSKMLCNEEEFHFEGGWHGR